jgi:amino acid adenylation domain-containing protein
VSASDARLSYAELEAAAGEVAGLLGAVGVGAGSLVGLCLDRSAALVVAALGILRAGAAYVAMDPSHPDDRLRYMLSDSQASALVTSSAVEERLRPSSVPTVLLDPGVDLGLTGHLKRLPEGARAGTGELAYVIYTSGSTGAPKGVMVEHASLSNLVEWHRRAFSMTPADRSTLVGGPGFDASVWEMWSCLTAGASLHVPTEALRRDPAQLRDWLVAERITVCFLPTTLAEAVLALDWPEATSLRLLLTGGDTLHRYPPPGLPFALVNNYGPTETTVVATSGMVAAEPETSGPPAIGRAIDGVTLTVVDEQLRPVPNGTPGELLIGGAGVARGYLHRDYLTNQRFIPDPTTGPGNRRRLYRTGDVVRVRADGELEFLGRSDDQVSIDGHRVELGEVSAALGRHPSVGACAVLAVDAREGARRLVACIVPAPGAPRDPAALRAHLRQMLPEPMIPSELVWLDELPVTAGGKLDRAALAEVAARAVTAPPDAPGGDLQAALAQMVARLLGVDAVGVTENFFLLGGHSLLGAQLIALIAERFGADLPLRDLFDHPTVAEIAHLVEARLIAEIGALSDEEAERQSRELAGGAA